MSQLLYEYLVVLHLNLDSDENVRRVLKYSLKFIEKGLAVHTAFVHVTRYSVDRGFCQIAHRAQTPEYCSHTSKSSGVKFDSGALSSSIQTSSSRLSAQLVPFKPTIRDSVQQKASK